MVKEYTEEQIEKLVEIKGVVLIDKGENYEFRFNQRTYDLIMERYLDRLEEDDMVKELMEMII